MKHELNLQSWILITAQGICDHKTLQVSLLNTFVYIVFSLCWFVFVLVAAAAAVVVV